MLDRLGELGHRDAGHDERRRSAIVVLDRRDRALHRRELLGRLDPPELVDERRAGAEAVEPDDPPRLSAVSAQTRSPTATVAAGPRPRTTRSKIAGPSSVSLTTTTSPSGSSRRSNAANMRGRTKTGSAPGRKNAPVTQPCAYDDLAEVRDLPLDAGQVLEVGRRREEEDVDALRLQALAEPPAPLA